MVNVTLNDVYRAAMQLPPEDQDALLERLQLQKRLNRSEAVTRQTLLAELDRRRAAGLYENLESLEGKFARSGAAAVNPDEVDAYLRSLNSEWEEDLDHNAR
jgi:hypothetical protein